MDIGVNMVEKNGLFLERYSIWDSSSEVAAKNMEKVEQHFAVDFNYLDVEVITDNFLYENVTEYE